MSATSTDIDEKWSRYPATVLELEPPGSARIDLREPIGDRERRLLERLELGRPFAVLTAENPWGENVEDAPTQDAERRRREENTTRCEALEKELTASGISFRRVDGVAPDGNYRERGVALSASRDEAVAIARRYRQLAIFWYDGRDFSLVGAVARKPDERLPT